MGNNTSSAVAWAQGAPGASPATTAGAGASVPPAAGGAAAAAPAGGTAQKPKKICCACPDTRKVRDECVLKDGEEKCKAAIDAHIACLRSEGFNV